MDAEIEQIQKKINGHEHNITYLQLQVYELEGQNAKLRKQIEECPHSLPPSSDRPGSIKTGGDMKAMMPKKEAKERWEYVNGKWESKWTTEWD